MWLHVHGFGPQSCRISVHGVGFLSCFTEVEPAGCVPLGSVLLQTPFLIVVLMACFLSFSEIAGSRSLSLSLSLSPDSGVEHIFRTLAMDR